MTDATFTLAEPARMQVENLPATDRLALRRLFTDDRADGDSASIGDGTFVSRLGARRVLWRRDEEGRPVVLSVVDRSYAAHP